MKLHVKFNGNKGEVKSAEYNSASKSWDLDLEVEFAADEFVAATKLFNDAYKGIITDVKPLLEAEHQRRLEELRYEHELKRSLREEREQE